MASPSLHGRWALLLGCASILGISCSASSLPYFFLPEAKQPPLLMKLSGADKIGEANVAILAYYASAQPLPEFVRVDRELSSLLAQHLQKECKDNKEKVHILAPRKVEKYKDEHPSWRTRDLTDVGKALKVDYVIYLEIDSLGLYEKDSANLMYRGRSSISVQLVDVRKSDEDPLQRTYRCEYPTNHRGPVPIDDRSLPEFRQEFLDYMAKHLTWYFAEHPSSEEYGFDLP